VFHVAQARIQGETVVVSSPNVAQPVAVRYAWADNPIGNLYNQVHVLSVFRMTGSRTAERA
jgi:hypothetical protein